MPFITEPRNWFLLYFFGAFFLIWRGGAKGRITVLVLIITIIFTDQVNSFFIKELFCRIRPCHVLNNIHLLVPCGGGKSFPSSHAVNNFAAAYILSKFYKKNRMLFFSIAIVVAFSRVYIGVHYPSDVIGGAFIGLFMGFIIMFCYKIVIKRTKFNQLLQSKQNLPNNKGPDILL